MRELKKPNDLSVLDDFPFMIMDFGEELGPVKFITDMDSEERVLFVIYGPEVFN